MTTVNTNLSFSFLETDTFVTMQLAGACLQGWQVARLRCSAVGRGIAMCQSRAKLSLLIGFHQRNGSNVTNLQLGSFCQIPLTASVPAPLGTVMLQLVT